MEQKVKRSKKWLSVLSKVLFVLILLVCSVVIFFNLSHEYYDVLGPSMSPTINEGVVGESEKKDGVFVSKIKSIVRGDIVVAKKISQNSSAYHVIKRVIALGGDKIKIENIDGVNRIVLIKAGENAETIVEEKYLKNYSLNSTLKTEFDNMIIECELQVDESGFLSIPSDSVFYLGDNRQSSIDSADYGPVNRSNIVGKVDYIIYGNTNIYGQVIQQFFGW